MADIIPLGVRYFAEGHEQVKQANRDVASTGREAEQATTALAESQTRAGAAAREFIAANAGATRSTREQINALTGVTRANREAAQSTKDWVAELQQQASSFDRVRASLDPLFAASKSYEQAQREISAAVRAGIVSQEEGNRVLDMAAQRYLGLGGVTANTTRAQSDFLASAGGSSHVLRMMSFQLNQVAQSGAANGMWMQAAIVQIPDMLGLFGSLPLVLAGGAAALIGSFLPALLSSDAGAKEFTDTLGELVSAVDEYRAAADLAMQSGEELAEVFGSQAEAVRETLTLIAQLRFEESLDRLRDAATGASDQLDEMRSLADAVAEGRTYTTGRWFRTFSEDVGLSLGQMQMVVAAMDQMGRARGPDEASDAARDLNTLLLSIYGTVENIPPEMRKVALAAAEVDVEAAKILATTEDLADETDDVGLGFSRAASEAERMAEWLGVSVDMARKWNEQGLDFGVPGAPAYRGDPREFGGSATDWQTRDAERFESLYDAAQSGILDLIAAAEGTAGADNYNETLGYGRFTGGDVNLVNMTLRQVMELQSRMLADPSNNFNSSAVGRYQITRETLGDLMGRLGLSGEEQFSAGLQDRLAEELIRWRGANTGSVRGTWEGLQGVPDSLIQQALGRQTIPEQDPELTRAQTTAAREAEKAERDRERALDRSQNAYDRLRSSIDPAVAASVDFAAAQEVIREALENGQISAEEAAVAMAAVEREYQETLGDLASERVETMRNGFESLTSTLLRAAAAGDSVGEALRNFLLDAAIQAAARSLANTLTSLFSGGAGGGGGFFGGIVSSIFGGVNAKGNAFDGGSVVAFARGGVVNGDTYFDMSGGRVGLMGEAGPEAIMPLTRGPDGKLGVHAQGGQAAQQQTATRVEVVPSPYFDVRVTQVSAPLVQSGMRASAQQFGNIASGYNERGTT